MSPSGYTLRFCTSKDVDAAARMIQTVFMGLEEYGEWTRMLMSGAHPSARAHHTLAAVEDSSGEIVSAVIGCPQHFTYAGLPLPVINLAIVGTLPAHREKGLLRALVDHYVAWARQAGFQALVVFGIAGLYRRLGFLPLLPYGGGTGYALTSVRRRFAEISDPAYSIRPARAADLPLLARLHDQVSKRSLISFPYDEGYWRLAAFDYFEANRDQVRVIERGGAFVGGFAHSSQGGTDFTAYALDLAPGNSWLETLPVIMRYLAQTADDLAKASGAVCETLTLSLDSSHSALDLLDDIPHRRLPNTLGYIRFSDLSGLLRHMAPVLERRIAESPLCGYTRVVRIELYYRQQGLVLEFERGRLLDVRDAVIEGYETVVDRAEVEIPFDAFLELVCGVKSIDELAYNFREVNTWNGQDGLAPEFRLLLRTLFPKSQSFIYPCL